MPRATTNINDTERIDLKTCPGGYVVLRRMNYGEMLERRAMVGKLNVSGNTGSRNSREFAGFMQLMSRKVVEFEFANCIVDHNLDDENELRLDFKNPMALTQLDPRIGEEIGTHIDRMNQFEDELPNSKTGSGEA